MRVITGTARGRRLKTPADNRVRPTTDKVKEAVFSILQFSLYGRVFLDLFAGTGQMGIEALSRGAERSLFVDSSKASLALVEENVQLTGFSDRAAIIRADYRSYLAGLRQTVDVAFLDPPYQKDILPQALELLIPHMAPDGCIVCEHAPEDALPEAVGNFYLQKKRTYGRIIISVYTPQEEIA